MRLKKLLIFNVGMTLLIGWRGGKGGERVKAGRAIWKVTYGCRLSFALQKKHTLIKKRAVTCVKQREDRHWSLTIGFEHREWMVQLKSGFEGKQYSSSLLLC